ncbi:MAG: hypothetical protein AAGG75_12045 [Bacteroidota bacterium]
MNSNVLTPKVKSPAATATKITVWPYLSVLLQLGFAAVLIHLFQIEGDLGLPAFWPLLIAAFCVHALAPKAYRPMIFFGSFVATLIFFLGEVGAAKVLLMGGVLLGLCHLPVPMALRRGLVFLAGVALVLMSTGYWPSPLDSWQMRIFASLFMFRVILYLYELPHEKKGPSIWQRLNYFFLLPNIIFPLFPIVDYQGFQKKYFNQKDIIIYQRGADLILWSLCCLLIYRWIYLFGIPSVLTVDTVGEVLHYMIATYLTVIRLVGLLGLSVGILRLFGYNLPDIFNYMFFASSFADLFRRINIYWKDFLMKICYYPTYFRIRKWTPTYALTIAMAVTFFFTWIFHLYQWFWILGSNPLRDTSIIYWGLFGVIATLNTLFEGNKRKAKPNYSFQFAAWHSFKVLSTFLMMSLLYSLWVSPGVGNWMALIITATQDNFSHWLQLAALLLLVWGGAAALYFIYLNNWERQKKALLHSNAILRSLGIGFLVVMAALAYNQPPEDSQLGIFIQNEKLNEKDNDQQFTGYYNEVLEHKDVASRLWGMGFGKKQKKDFFADLDNVDDVDNVMLYAMRPNSSSTFKGQPLTVNRWGMRDQDYEKVAPPNTIRIAMVGSSPVMGVGVADDEVFEKILEDRLNKNYGSDSLRFELLNFAQPSTGIHQHAFMLEDKIRHFRPDYILDIEHCRNFIGYIRKLKNAKDAGVTYYPALAALLEAENIDPDQLSEAEKEEKGKLIAAWGYKHFRQLCQKYEIQPIWIFLPGVSKSNILEEYLPMVKSAGFEKVISLEDIFSNYNQKLLQVSTEDKHPNPQAHRLIAQRLEMELVRHLGLEEQ